MRAIVQERYGSPDVLALREVEVPSLRAGQVRVRVVASSVNAGDWYALTGTPYLLRTAMGLRRPRHRIPGRDVAGVIHAVGEGVSSLQPGDAVFGEIVEAYAEFAVAPADRVALKPAAISFEQAAATPVAGLTAYQALTRVAQVAPGQHVAVNGAAGGVGSFTVQIAKALGAEVTGVCSAANAPFVRALGADHVLDYATTSLTTGSYDVIVDLAGNHSLGALRRSLRPRGAVVLVSGAGGRWFGPVGRMLAGALLSPVVPGRLVPLASRQTAEDLAAVADLLASGALVPAIDRTFALEEVSVALALQGSGHARGKRIIQIAS
jgi:NADPH:quinone reductase-like Zn-dependent oxidoreductase